LKNKNLLFFTPLLIALFSAITYWMGFYQHNQNIPSYNKWKNIEHVLNTIENRYVDSVSMDNLLEKSINNILETLDPHSAYLPFEKTKSENEVLAGHFGGVGIRFMIIRDSLVVINAIKEGPSFLAGIEKRDRIIKVNGENIASVGIKNSDVLKLLKGPINSSVTITVYSPKSKKEKTVQIKRGMIAINSVAASLLLNENIGYLKLSNFSDKSEKEVFEAIEALKKAGMSKLILDLRFNGGGYLHGAVGVADQFLENNKLIVYTEGIHSPKREFNSSEKGVFKNGDLIVLANSLSASASEIVCGALQDHKRAIIMGRRTFGKGLVQQQIVLNDSSELRITTSRYYTPSGKCIQKPYGENINYEDDIYQRMDNGELTSSEDIKDTSSKKYGAGGIIPNIFIPIDTSMNSFSFNELLYTATVRDFCFDFYESHPSTSYSKIENFNTNFTVSSDMIKELLLRTDIIKIGNLSTNELRELKWRVKGEIASYYFNDNSKYLIYSSEDIDISTAIKYLSK
jgi:carboxyl-terminal processing protease